MTSRPLHRPGDLTPRAGWPPPDAAGLAEDEPTPREGHFLRVADVVWSGFVAIGAVVIVAALVLGLAALIRLVP